MATMREDARRALNARRERVFATPAPLAAPLVWTLVPAALVTLLLVLLDVRALTLALALFAIAFVAAVAARRTIVSLFAGLALWAIRPYRRGEQVRLDAPEYGGEVEAEVLRIGIVNTTLDADAGLLVVANTRMLHASSR